MHDIVWSVISRLKRYRELWNLDLARDEALQEILEDQELRWLNANQLRKLQEYVRVFIKQHLESGLLKLNITEPPDEYKSESNMNFRKLAELLEGITGRRPPSIERIRELEKERKAGYVDPGAAYDPRLDPKHVMYRRELVPGSSTELASEYVPDDDDSGISLPSAHTDPIQITQSGEGPDEPEGTAIFHEPIPDDVSAEEAQAQVDKYNQEMAGLEDRLKKWIKILDAKKAEGQ